MIRQTVKFKVIKYVEYSKVEECNESKEQSFNRISPKYKIDLDHGFEKDLPKINPPQLVPDDCELSCNLLFFSFNK